MKHSCSSSTFVIAVILLLRSIEGKDWSWPSNFVKLLGRLRWATRSSLFESNLSTDNEDISKNVNDSSVLVKGDNDVPTIIFSPSIDINEERTLRRPCLVYRHRPENSTQTEWSCQLNSFDYFGEVGHILEIQGLYLDTEEEESIVSGKMVMMVKDAKIRGYVIDVANSTSITFEAAKKATARSVSKITIGERTVMAWLIKGRDTEFAMDIAELTDNVYKDTVNLRSQYSECSYGKLRLIPYQGEGYNQERAGAGTIILDSNVTGLLGSVVVNMAISAINSDPNNQWVRNVDHHMFFLPETVILQSSVADFNRYSWFPYHHRFSISHMMHEIGHNLQLRHSGSDLSPYGDGSCLMGGSRAEDDIALCFNGAKSWELEWYTDAQTMYRASSDVISRNETYFDIVGVADYDRRPLNSYVVVRIFIDGNSDYFVAFNRQRGINRDNEWGGNQVLVTQWTDGEFSESRIRAYLDSGESYKIDGIGISDASIVISVEGISGDLESDAEIAVARVNFCRNCPEKEAETVPPQNDEPGICQDSERCFLGRWMKFNALICWQFCVLETLVPLLHYFGNECGRC